jgi:peptidoglycan hydrolase-like protein with peptidoglycan-binding domain
MVAERKMRNKIHKYILLIPVCAFFFFSVFSYVNANNYGEGVYNSDLYSSSTTTNDVTGTTQAFRDKFLAEQQAKRIALQQQSNTIITTTSDPINITRILKLKMKGNDVKQLQIYLNTHGYIVSTTGAGSLNNETNYFGLKTRQAVMKFQKANGLKVDGIVGPQTRLKLK